MAPAGDGRRAESGQDDTARGECEDEDGGGGGSGGEGVMVERIRTRVLYGRYNIVLVVEAIEQVVDYARFVLGSTAVATFKN